MSTNKDKIKQYNADYYSKHKAYHKQYHIEYYEKNKEKLKQHRAQYQEANKSKIKQHTAEYRLQNIEKERQDDRDYYRKNKGNENSPRNKRMARNRKFVRDYKQTLCCVDCGMTNWLCFDFHHEGDDKINTIASMSNRGYSIARIQNELKKCICLCANCHRIRHNGNAWEQQPKT